MDKCDGQMWRTDMIDRHDGQTWRTNVTDTWRTDVTYGTWWMDVTDGCMWQMAHITSTSPTHFSNTFYFLHHPYTLSQHTKLWRRGVKIKCVGKVCYLSHASIYHVHPSCSVPYVTSIRHMSVTSVHHVCQSLLSIMSVSHFCTSCKSITSVRHVCLSCPSITSVCNICLSRLSITVIS